MGSGHCTEAQKAATRPGRATETCLLCNNTHPGPEVTNRRSLHVISMGIGLGTRLDAMLYIRTCRAAERGGPGGLLTLGPVVKHGARAARLVSFSFCVCVLFCFDRCMRRRCIRSVWNRMYILVFHVPYVISLNSKSTSTSTSPGGRKERKGL